MVRRAVIPDEDEFIPEDDDEGTPAEAADGGEDYEGEPEPAPRRQRQRVADDAEDLDPPATKTRRARVTDEDGEEEKRLPRKAAASTNGTKRRTIKRGWQAGQKTIDNNRGPTTYAKAYQDNPTTQVLKFLEDEPYASYARHWVARVDAEGNKKNRPYVCLGTFDEACPLCDVLGDKPQSVNSFNIAVLDEDGEDVTHYTWDVGPRLFDTLKSFREDPKIKTLTKGFWGSRRSGKGFQTMHHVTPIRSAATLLEDYEMEAPPTSVYAEIELYEADIISVPTYEELEEIAEELANSDDYE